MTKADNKKYSATVFPNHITMATTIKVFEFFLKRVCWVRLFIEIPVCARLEVSSDLSGRGFVYYVCLRSWTALFCISACFSWPLSFAMLCTAPWTKPPLLLSPTWPPISNHCLPSRAASLWTQQHPPTFSRATSHWR